MVGGLDPRYDKRGVGAVRFRPDTKSGAGRVVVVVSCTLHAGTIRKAGGGGGCLAEEGEVPYMKVQLDDLLRFTIDY